MKLIDAVRKTRESNHKYFAIDSNMTIFSYSENNKPIIKSNDICFLCDFSFDKDKMLKLGKIDKLYCDWKDTLVDVDKIKVS